LSLILPQEQLLIDALKTQDIDRPAAKENTIHQLFSEQVSRYSQKVAVELDEQMLTYTELYFYAQQLVIVLRDSNGVKKGDIICQCVERSISMVR
jgi:non-ribosomal peptide synthetase component F